MDLQDVAQPARLEEQTAPLSPTMSQDARPAPIGAVLRVLDAASTPVAFRLKHGSCVVGSAPTCDLSVLEPTVSRTHVELALVPEGVVVRDLGSRNGTFYQGQRVEKMLLALGGRLTLGAATLAIDADTEGLTEHLDYPGSSYRGMVGVSRAMRQLFGVLSRLEGSLATVLILGESGVGKELVARALHEGSSVSDGPFVALNCAALPRDVIANELLGERRGALDSAAGGTLFLDEVGELPLDVQPLLLRAIAGHDGGPAPRSAGDARPPVKVRLVAATNRDLEADARAGKFRRDLFYRLAVVQLPVPALRERPEDIEPLARRFAAAMGLSGIQKSVVEQLKSRAWPGNARELENAIQAYVALGQLPRASRTSMTDALEQGFADLVDVRRPYTDQKEGITERFTKVYLQALIAHTNGNQSLAAKLAGLNRSYLGRLLVKHGLIKDPNRARAAPTASGDAPPSSRRGED